jgi:ribosome biogenesis protein MAK21
MKSIIVREIISLVLKSPTSSVASSTLHSQQSASAQNTKIRFADAPTTSDIATNKKEDRSKKNGGNPHARYYATITFNQIVLSPTSADNQVAKELIDVYFELFKELLGEGKVEDDALINGDGATKQQDPKGEQRKPRTEKKGKGKEAKGEAGFTEVENSNSKLVSAILTGVNRALPYAKMDVGDVRYVFFFRMDQYCVHSWTFFYHRFNKHIDTLFLITHKSTFNTSLQALLLILQITTSMSPDPSSSSLPEFIRDRYYRTLYASLFDPRLSQSAKQAMYLNLLFKSLKVDKNEERVKSFVRRFIQVLANGGGGGGAEFTVGGLYLLGEVSSTFHLFTQGRFLIFHSYSILHPD